MSWVTKAQLRHFKTMKIGWVAARLGLTIKNGTHAHCFRARTHNREDRTPSLSFNSRTNRFKCFGCGLGGDTLDLVRQFFVHRDGRPRAAFQQAVTFLQGLIEEHGLAVPLADAGAEPIFPGLAQWQVYQSLIEFCGPSLTELSRGYLEERGISEALALARGVRSIPDYSVFDQLKALHGPEAVSAAGLRSRNGHFIFYRHRLLFFFFDRSLTSMPIYVIGRTIGDSKLVRNRYTRPQGLSAPCFFNVDDLRDGPRADQQAPGADAVAAQRVPLIVCEGQMDCLSAVAMGYRAVGYPSHFRHDWLPHIPDQELWIAAQGDPKGRENARLLNKLFKQQGKLPRIVALPLGQDLNDLWQRGDRLPVNQPAPVSALENVSPANTARSTATTDSAQVAIEMSVNPRRGGEYGR
jgi:hypothetical protein